MDWTTAIGAKTLEPLRGRQPDSLAKVERELNAAAKDGDARQLLDVLHSFIVDQPQWTISVQRRNDQGPRQTPGRWTRYRIVAQSPAGRAFAYRGECEIWVGTILTSWQVWPAEDGEVIAVDEVGGVTRFIGTAVASLLLDVFRRTGMLGLAASALPRSPVRGSVAGHKPPDSDQWLRQTLAGRAPNPVSVSTAASSWRAETRTQQATDQRWLAAQFAAANAGHKWPSWSGEAIARIDPQLWVKAVPVWIEAAGCWANRYERQHPGKTEHDAFGYGPAAQASWQTDVEAGQHDQATDGRRETPGGRRRHRLLTRRAHA